MSKYPTNFSGQDRLQPGARGEKFKTDMPGYRTGEQRINRTNMKLSMTCHESPNIKYELDRRLTPLFRYGYAYGYNQIAVPKGRIMAVDPAVNLIDFDTKKGSNAITLANGGVPVKLKDDGQWEPIDKDAYEALKTNKENIFRGLKKSAAVQMEEAKLTFDEATGYLKKDGKVDLGYRPANVPIGMIIRNEYTRYDNAQNGMQPGGFNTDCMVELPMFLLKEKAEENPWGSIYGNLTPGDLVKSDENGRLVVSPLSRMDYLATPMDAMEIEKERQQVVGQIYSISRDLVPAGAAKYATWALSDRMNFDEFNPLEFRQTNRDREDVLDKSAHNLRGGGAVNNNINMTGKDPFEYPGAPYDKGFSDNDLHMMSAYKAYSHRMDQDLQYENLGIPGLTDGYNAVVRDFPEENIGKIYNRGKDKGNKYLDLFVRTAETNLNSLKLKVENGTEVEITNNSVGQAVNDFLKVKFVDLLQGLIVLEVSDDAKADAGIPEKDGLAIFATYTKRGLAGVPTFMDWDGCVGTARILLQK